MSWVHRRCISSNILPRSASSMSGMHHMSRGHIVSVGTRRGPSISSSPLDGMFFWRHDLKQMTSMN